MIVCFFIFIKTEVLYNDENNAIIYVQGRSFAFIKDIDTVYTQRGLRINKPQECSTLGAFVAYKYET